MLVEVAHGRMLLSFPDGGELDFDTGEILGALGLAHVAAEGLRAA